MQQYHYSQPAIPQPALLILACLADGPKTATELREAAIQVAGEVIEPGTFSRVVARLERKGWITGDDSGERLSQYHITASGLLALQREEAKYQQNQEVQGHRRGGSDLFKEKERLVLWILRLYPPAWRERYETEMIALLEQHHLTLWTVLDLFLGALDARLDPHYHHSQQLILLRRFQTSWRMVIGAFVAFWIALLPWFWFSVLGISSADSTWSYCGDNYATCLFRVDVGRHTPGWPLVLVHWIFILLPFLLIGFTLALVQAYNRRARVRLWLALPVAVVMVALNVACLLWYFSLWQFLPQVNRYFSFAPAGLLLGLIGMGLASILALVALTRATVALRLLSGTPSGQEFSAAPVQVQVQGEQITGASHQVPSNSRRRELSTKFWKGTLAVLMVVFLLPWPSLFNPAAPSFRVSFFTWCFAAIVGGVTVLPVAVHNKNSDQPVIGKGRSGIFTISWYVVFPSVLFGLTLLSILLIPAGRVLWLFELLTATIVAGSITILLAAMFGNRQGRGMPRQPRDKIAMVLGAVLLFFMLIVFIQPNLVISLRVSLGGLEDSGWIFVLLPFLTCICILCALIVRKHIRDTQTRRMESLRGGLSPKVWTVILPVWLIAFCMNLEYFSIADYNGLGNVLMAWLFTGLAGLIIVVTMKIGSSRFRNTQYGPSSASAHPTQPG